jgi:hypothetical protein
MGSSGCSDRRIWRRLPCHDPGGAPFLVAKVGTSEIEELRFPKFDYYLDESDPDIVILRRQDGSFVAPFSASGATRDGILEAAKDDYGKLMAAYAAP